MADEIKEKQQVEKSLMTAGQRRINLMWEVTQSLIALSVTISSLYVAINLSLTGSTDSAAFLLLSNSFFLVIGFYFGRTNHQKIGGVKSQDENTR
ncbi:MAG: hypothetical protein NUV65_05980 [Candidatus Roizmanbacteria bacterium]|nr:hypothetical protein [Candidatus Roizmanbacteria bacterium]